MKRAKEYDIHCLVTSMNEHYQRVSMHGVRKELIEQQAQSLGIKLYPLMVPEKVTMDVYDHTLSEVLKGFKREGVDYSIFGDIFLEDLRRYRENQLAKVGLKGAFPIWKRPTADLAREFIDLGFKSVIVCVDERHLPKEFVGRNFDQSFLDDLPQQVDPCGENGEFHSFVTDGPIFQCPIEVQRGEIVYKKYLPTDSDDSSNNQSYSSHPSDAVTTGFWYCDLLLKDPVKNEAV